LFKDDSSTSEFIELRIKINIEKYLRRGECGIFDYFPPTGVRKGRTESQGNPARIGGKSAEIWVRLNEL
jgi:hypothetical protein